MTGTQVGHSRDNFNDDARSHHDQVKAIPSTANKCLPAKCVHFQEDLDPINNEEGDLCVDIERNEQAVQQYHARRK